MTKSQIIKKLNKIQDLIDELVFGDINELIEENNERIELINEKSYERDSGELTEREQERIAELEELNEVLESIADNINVANFEDALDELGE